MEINFTYPDKVITFTGDAAQSIMVGIRKALGGIFVTPNEAQSFFKEKGWELRFTTSIPPRMCVVNGNDMMLFPIWPNPDGTFCTEKKIEPVSLTTGLTPEEDVILDHLVQAWTGFIKLEKQHPNEFDDFAKAMNQCQSTLAMRAVRRTWPEGWPMK